MTTLETLTKLANATNAKSTALIHERGSYDRETGTWTAFRLDLDYIEAMEEAEQMIRLEMLKISPILSGDCLYGDHGSCSGSESAIWPDGDQSVRDCSCDCHTSKH